MFLDTLERRADGRTGEPALAGHSTSPHCSPSSCTRINATSSVLPGLLLAGKQLWKAAGHLPVAHARASGLHGAWPAAQRP